MPPTTKQIRLLTGGFVLLLFLSLAVIYGQVATHEFINFDDNVYIYENSKVQAGLSLGGFTWAFVSTHASNWHPVTWLSHMFDCQLFGLDAGWHHASGVFLHALNAGLLFWFLLIATEKFGASAFVSLLFALHPLHVESVAWASERKDLLSTLFMLLTLISYVSYSMRSRLWNYCAVASFFVLGLMSKPMLVTLPFLLFLLDYWPLSRRGQAVSSGLQEHYSGTAPNKERNSFLVYEKIPLLIFSGISCVITFFVQQHSGAVKSLQMIPLGLRIANALVSYVAYLSKMVWPVDLAILYPYPETISLWRSGGAALIILTISLTVFLVRKKQPFLVVGWFWYLVAMIPVIGLVQVGVQSMADRYTYIPLIGIFIMISFGLSSACRLVSGKITWPAALLVLFVLAVLAIKQISFWKNSEVLFLHALTVTENNYAAHNYLAKALADNGNYSEAEKNYRAALVIRPNFSEAMVNLAVILAEQGKIEQAYAYLTKAARRESNNPKILNNLGSIYKNRAQLEKATEYYRKALAADSSYKEAMFNLANTLEKQDQFHESITLYQKVIVLYPAFAEAFNGLGVALARNGNKEESIAYFRQAVELKPGYVQAENNLEMVTRKASK